jgi:hypothetical protein
MAVGDNLNKAKQEAQELNQELALIADAISSIGDSLRKDFVAELEKVGDLTKEQKNNLAGTYSKGFKEASKAVESVAVALAKQKEGTLKLSEIQKLQNKLVEIKAKKQLVLNQAELYGVELSEEKLKALNDEIAALDKGVAKIKDSQTKFGGLAALASEKFKSLNLNVKDLAGVVLKFAVQKLKEFDTETVNIQRNFAVTKKEAIQINQQLARTAVGSKTLGVNLESVTRGVNSLNEELGGTALLFTEDIQVGMAELTDRQKLSVKAAASFTTQAINSGKAVDTIRAEQEATFKAVKASTGVALNFTQTLEEAGQISGALRLNLEATPGGLTEAVAMAKSLGVEMNAILGTQASILDFETSIANELAAEAIIGRDINLERARLAAMNNDIAGLTQEIAAQFGSVEEFQSLNYLQQEAFAKALGMSKDQLAEQLRTQQSINEQIETGVETAGDSLTQNSSALSAQEALTESINSLNSILKTSLGLIMGIATAAAILLAIPTGGLSLGALGVIGATTGGAAAVAGGVGLAAGVGTAALVSDGMAPSSKGPFTITDSYGATAVTTAGDNVVVSPNVNSGGGGGITSAQANKMISLLEKVANKDFSVSMDGRKLSDAMQTSGVSYSS